LSGSIHTSRKRSPALAVGAGIILIIALISIIRQQIGEEPSNKVWYYDVGSGELFPSNPDQILPIDAPSGAGNGVLAYVVACGACTESNRTIVYLKSNTPEAAQALKKMPDPTDATAVMNPAGVIAAESGRLIATLPGPGEKPRWILESTPQADAIRVGDQKLCASGDQMLHCSP